MMIANKNDAYGTVSKTLHWVMATLIIGLVLVGWVMVDAAPGGSKWFLYGTHKSVGLTVLVLSGFRLLWRLFTKNPDPIPASPLMQIGARAVHGGLYAMMFIMPLSGLLMSLYGGHAVSFFGLFSLDPLSQGPTNWGNAARVVHIWSSYGLTCLFVLHVGGALFHHFVLKDGTLRRMMGGA